MSKTDISERLFAFIQIKIFTKNIGTMNKVKKKNYEKPLLMAIEMHPMQQILAGSTETKVKVDSWNEGDGWSGEAVER